MFAADFDTFWREYPRKVGKLAAQKEYERARKHATAEQILAGVLAFKRHLPHEERFIAHPRTWLSQGRWMDEDARPRCMPVAEDEDWYDQCGRLHNHECGLSRYRHLTRMQVGK